MTIRLALLAAAALALAGCGAPSAQPAPADERAKDGTPGRAATAGQRPRPGTALAALEKLEVKGRAPKTGYDREQFGGDWASLDGCDMRERILQRDLREIAHEPGSACEVQSGALADPYTASDDPLRARRRVRGRHRPRRRPSATPGRRARSSGATTRRVQFANDPLNLLAVDASANRQKGDSDAASWLPRNKRFRCAYVARQIAVKRRYRSWVTPAEHDAMQRVLAPCPRTRLPQSSLRR